MNNIVLFQELLCDNGKKVGIATLNSERSLNALSGDMIEALYPQLSNWHQDKKSRPFSCKGQGRKPFAPAEISLTFITP